VRGERFLAEVEDLAELDSNEEARNAVAGTLESLRERLAGQEPSNLASHLRGDGGRESFAVEEFCERVARKEGVGKDEATRHARAVATVLQTAVTGGELDDVRSQPGAGYEEPFGQTGAST
jgi:uncharacterized protein (DUF2267 family)